MSKTLQVTGGECQSRTLVKAGPGKISCTFLLNSKNSCWGLMFHMMFGQTTPCSLPSFARHLGWPQSLPGHHLPNFLGQRNLVLVCNGMEMKAPQLRTNSFGKQLKQTQLGPVLLLYIRIHLVEPKGLKERLPVYRNFNLSRQVGRMISNLCSSEPPKSMPNGCVKPDVSRRLPGYVLVSPSLQESNVQNPGVPFCEPKVSCHPLTGGGRR